MKHDLTPDIVEQLKLQYEEDLARTRAMYSTPWRQYTSAGQFERPRTFERKRPSLLLAVLVWLVACLAIGGVVRFIDAVRVPLSRAAPVEAVRSWFGSFQ